MQQIQVLLIQADEQARCQDYRQHTQAQKEMSVTGMDRIIDRINALMRATREVGDAAADAHDMMTERIFNEGLASNGAPIGGGKGYSPQYKKMREKRGRQTGKIDLRMNGDMELDFIVRLGSDGVWESAFMSGDEAEKASHNEKRYGQRIFDASAREKEEFKKNIQAITKRFLK